MTCSACRCQQASGAFFCVRCGARMPAAAAYSAGPQPWMPLTEPATPYAQAEPATRVGQNLQALGVLWCAYGGYRIVSLFTGAAMLHHLERSGSFGDMPPFLFGFLHTWGPAIAVLILAKALLSVASGFALLARKPWARTLAILLGIWSLLKLPVGTALGIYTLWVLAPAASGREWQSIKQDQPL